MGILCAVQCVVFMKGLYYSNLGFSFLILVLKHVTAWTIQEKISSFNKTFYWNHDFQQNLKYITTINIIKELVWNTCWNNSLWQLPKSQVLVVITNECMHRGISIYHIMMAFKLFYYVASHNEERMHNISSSIISTCKKFQHWWNILYVPETVHQFHVFK
jgi:hypothetical protein